MWVKFNSSGIWYHVDVSIVTNVSEELFASVITAQEVQQEFVEPEDGDSEVLRLATIH
jgi:hypothetical protein